MKSSKKFMTRILTAALALSMVAGTGVCAAAVEEPAVDDAIAVTEELDVVAHNQSSLKALLSKLLASGFPKEKIKELISEVAAKAYSKIPPQTIAKLTEIASKLGQMSDLKDQIGAAQQQMDDEIAAAIEEFHAAVDALYEEFGEDDEKIQEAAAELNGILMQQIETSFADFEEFKQLLAEQVGSQKAVEIAQAVLNIEQQISGILNIKDQIAYAQQIMDSEITAAYEEFNAAVAAVNEEYGEDSQEAYDKTVELDAVLHQKIDAAFDEYDAFMGTLKEQVGNEKIVQFAEAWLNVEHQIQLSKAAFEQRKAEILSKLTKYTYDKDAKAFYYVENDFLYRINISLKNGITACAESYIGDDTSDEMAIPAFADGIPVTGIYFELPQGVKTVYVSNIVENLNGASFWNADGCTVENIIVDEANPYMKSVDGIVYSLDGTSLKAVPSGRTEVTVPEEVIFIDDCAFSCSQAVSVKLPSTLEAIGNFAFESCEALETITIPDGVFSIGNHAFLGCPNLKKAVIPSSVEKIGEEAFLGTNEEFTIYCDAVDSYAMTYAEENYINVSGPLKVELLAHEVVALGDTVSLTAKAKYGAGDYKYAFYYKKEGDSKWTTKQGFKDNDSVEISPQFEGVYDVCLKVKDANGTVVKKYAKMNVITVLDNATTVSAETIKKGETVTVNCASGEDYGKCLYAVYYKKTTDKKWVVKQDYSENTEVTIKPAKAADYIICVKMKTTYNDFVGKKYFNVKVEE